MDGISSRCRETVWIASHYRVVTLLSAEGRKGAALARVVIGDTTWYVLGLPPRCVARIWYHNYL